MKKILFLAFMYALAAMPLAAQESNKPAKGAILLETGFAPFSEGGSIQLQDGQIVGVYMMSDELGVRAGIEYQNTSASSDNGLTGDSWAKESGSASQLKFTPGLVRFFSGTDKMSPYVGAELIFATESNKVTAEAKDYEQVVSNSGELFNSFGLGAFGGFNWYFAKSLYVGAEIGVAFQSHSPKHSKTETTSGGSKETSEPAKDKANISQFGVYCKPFIRLGWSF